jgi:CheY-like chemotaxis protein
MDASAGHTVVPRRLILRAELHFVGGVLVTHTLGVTSSELTIACPRAIPLGQVVRIRLSFPGLVEPFELHARATEVRSSDGLGSPSVLTFAIERAAPEARSCLEYLIALRTIAPPPLDQAQPNYRAILVEDNAFIRDLFVFALEKYCADKGARLSLDVATNAVDAWTMLEAKAFDIALVDHFLPSETGAALIARLRADPRFAGVALVAISVGGDVARDATLGAGADMFLEKPLAMRDLLSTLDKLSRRRA